MSKKDKNPVALGKLLCPVCAEVSDSVILINMRLRDMSEVHNESVGFADKPCENCQRVHDMGACVCIMVDETRTTEYNLKEVFRTGQIHGIKKEALHRMFPSYKGEPTIFLPYWECTEKLGFPKNEAYEQGHKKLSVPQTN